MRKIIAFGALLAVIMPSVSFGATAKLAYTGWLPFWKKDSGAAETLANLSKLHSVSPFSYELDAEVGVLDKIVASENPWTGLYAEARAKGVKIVPSIASMDPDLIHSLLSDPVKRRVHIEDIMGTILIHNYDGIDIDYEGKYLKTKPYYSAFIKELSAALKARKKHFLARLSPALRRHPVLTCRAGRWNMRTITRCLTSTATKCALWPMTRQT